MATAYFPDRLNNIIIRNSGKSLSEYLRELAEADIKKQGWDKL